MSIEAEGRVGPLNRDVFGHPLSLLVVALGEFCMAFAYFAVQGMFVLFLTDRTSDGGMGLGEADALLLTGIAFGGAFILPLLGGWIADKFLGHRKAVVIGFSLLMLGYLGMAITSSISGGGAESTDNRPVMIVLLYGAVLLMAAGRGLATPANCILAVRAYKADDPRIDAGWIIYYWATNMGYLLSNLIIGTVGERLGWEWGFLSSTATQCIGLIVILTIGYRLLGAGDQSDQNTGAASRSLAPPERQAIFLVVLLYPFFLVFAVAYQQAIGVVNLFVYEHVDRTTPFMEIPATWFQSLLPGFSLVCAPVFSWVLLRMSRRGIKNIVIEKVIAGKVTILVGVLFLIMAALQVEKSLLASPWLIVVFSFCANAGDYLIFPAAAVLIGTAVPKQYSGLVMGFWLTGWGFGGFFANGLGSILSQHGELVFFYTVSGMLVVSITIIATLARYWKGAYARLLKTQNP